jgi:sec-independent protein translocase protein TatB
MFGIGFQEMAFLAVIALLVFGPKRLPELARTLGRGMAEFRRASADLRGVLSLDPDQPAPPPRPRRQEDEPDPREDRDYRPSPPQTVGGPDASAASAAEAAVMAELADEANDEKHRDATPDATPAGPAAGSVGGAMPGGAETPSAETDPSPSGRSD